MQLREAIVRLSEWPDMAMISAKRIDGEFRPESEAVVLELSEIELARPVREVAAERAPGMEYFLEIFIALEVVDGLRISQPHQKPSLERLLRELFIMPNMTPNQSPEPTAVGAVRSAIAVHVASRRWLSFLR